CAARRRGTAASTGSSTWACLRTRPPRRRGSHPRNAARPFPAHVARSRGGRPGWGRLGLGWTRRHTADGGPESLPQRAASPPCMHRPPTLPCDPTGGSMPMLQLRPWRYPALAFAIALLLAVGIATVWGLAELRGGVD